MKYILKYNQLNKLFVFPVCQKYEKKYGRLLREYIKLVSVEPKIITLRANLYQLRLRNATTRYFARSRFQVLYHCIPHVDMCTLYNTCIGCVETDR